MSDSNKTITAISGVTVGHVTDEQNATGVTVVRFAGDGARAAVSVQGAAPGSRETDLLDPGNLVDRVHAIVLTGGSAFGLDAASGVMAVLEEEGQGLGVLPDVVVPIVPAAVFSTWPWVPQMSVLQRIGVGVQQARPQLTRFNQEISVQVQAQRLASWLGLRPLPRVDWAVRH